MQNAGDPLGLNDATTGAGLTTPTATTAPTESSDGDAQYLSDDSDGSGGRARIAPAVGLGRCVRSDPVRIQPERRDQGAGLTTPTAPTAPTESSDGDAQYHNDGSSGSGGRARISTTRRNCLFSGWTIWSIWSAVLG